MAPKVFTIHFEAAITSKCRRCGTSLVSGHWAVVIQTLTKQQLLRQEPPLVCCGEVKDAPAIFPEEYVANGVRDAILHNLSVGRSVESLPLCSYNLADMS